ncbi:MAG: hypothetical protein LR011_08340 [Verrucomicrobia bacterium]|nr:hypothetical protein [Verrucomicrobiota bacterium]
MQNSHSPVVSWKFLFSMSFSGIILLWMMHTAMAQSSTQLYVETIQVAPGGGPLQMTFRDQGTGATEYMVEFSEALGKSEVWAAEQSAVIKPLGAGAYRIDIAEPREPNIFYRVVALTSAGPVVAEFANTRLQVTEGGTVEAVIQFSSPYTGPLSYRIEGPANGYAGPLSGTIMVNNSTTAAIALQIGDNPTTDELSFLSLIIQVGGRIQGGTDTQALITIGDNDAVWDGGFVSDGLEFIFKYRRSRNGSGELAALVSNGDGLIPAGEYPAQRLSPDQSFPATMRITLPSTASALELATTISLVLDSQPGNGGDVLTDDEVQGTALLTITYDGREHLNSTRFGRFILKRPPPVPSSSQTELIASP